MKITINRQHIQSQQTMNCGYEDKIEDIVLESISKDIESVDIESALKTARNNSEALFGPIKLAIVFLKQAEDFRVIFEQTESVTFIATHVDDVACDRYMLQSNHYHRQYRSSDKCEWFRNGIGWRTRSNFYDLEEAKKYLKNTSDLSRSIWPMRIIDLRGCIYKIFDQERDVRLPGCRWTKIQKDANKLWRKAGCPEGDLDIFEKQAEAEIDLAMDEGIYDFADYIKSCENDLEGQQFEEWLEKDYPRMWHEANNIGINAKKSGLSRTCNLSEHDDKFCHNGISMKLLRSAWEQDYDLEKD